MGPPFFPPFFSLDGRRERVGEVLNARIACCERREEIVRGRAFGAGVRDRERKEARRGDIMVRIELWDAIVVIAFESGDEC